MNNEVTLKNFVKAVTRIAKTVFDSNATKFAVQDDIVRLGDSIIKSRDQLQKQIEDCFALIGELPDTDKVVKRSTDELRTSLENLLKEHKSQVSADVGSALRGQMEVIEGNAAIVYTLIEDTETSLGHKINTAVSNIKQEAEALIREIEVVGGEGVEVTTTESGSKTVYTVTALPQDNIDLVSGDNIQIEESRKDGRKTYKINSSAQKIYQVSGGGGGGGGGTSITIGENQIAYATAENTIGGSDNLIYKDDRVGIGTADPTEALDVNSDKLRLRQTFTPSSSSDTAEGGEFAYDNNRFYVATDVDEWKQADLRPVGVNTPIPTGYLMNGQLDVTVNEDGELTVAIKTLSGDDPSPENPVTVRIEEQEGQITQAVTRTFTAGEGWFNSGNPDNQGQPLNYFVYLGLNTAYETPRFESVTARISYARTFSDFSTGAGNNDSVRHGGHSGSTIFNGTDTVGVVGRFTATMSAEPAAEWSSPTDIINRPIYETEVMRWNLQVTLGFLTLPTGILAEYKFVGRVCETWVRMTTDGVSNANTFRFNFPISSGTISGGGARYSDLIGIIDNGNFETGGFIFLSSGSRAAQVWRNNSATGWSTSGNKRLVGFFYSFPI